MPSTLEEDGSLEATTHALEWSWPQVPPMSEQQRDNAAVMMGAPPKDFAPKSTSVAAVPSLQETVFPEVVALPALKAPDAFELLFPGNLREIDCIVFETDLRMALKALGAGDETISALSVEFREGSIIAVVSGPLQAISELRRLDLQSLEVQGQIARLDVQNVSEIKTLPKQELAEPPRSLGSEQDAAAAVLHVEEEVDGLEWGWPRVPAMTDMQRENAAVMMGRPPSAKPQYIEAEPEVQVAETRACSSMSVALKDSELATDSASSRPRDTTPPQVEPFSEVVVEQTVAPVVPAAIPSTAAAGRPNGDSVVPQPVEGEEDVSGLEWGWPRVPTMTKMQQENAAVMMGRPPAAKPQDIAVLNSGAALGLSVAQTSAEVSVTAPVAHSVHVPIESKSVAPIVTEHQADGAVQTESWNAPASNSLAPTRGVVGKDSHAIQADGSVEFPATKVAQDPADISATPPPPDDLGSKLEWDWPPISTMTDAQRERAAVMMGRRPTAKTQAVEAAQEVDAYSVSTAGAMREVDFANRSSPIVPQTHGAAPDQASCSVESTEDRSYHVESNTGSSSFLSPTNNETEAAAMRTAVAEEGSPDADAAVPLQVEEEVSGLEWGWPRIPAMTDMQRENAAVMMGRPPTAKFQAVEEVQEAKLQPLDPALEVKAIAAEELAQRLEEVASLSAKLMGSALDAAESAASHAGAFNAQIEAAEGLLPRAPFVFSVPPRSPKSRPADEEALLDPQEATVGSAGTGIAAARQLRQSTLRPDPPQ